MCNVKHFSYLYLIQLTEDHFWSDPLNIFVVPSLSFRLVFTVRLEDEGSFRGFPSLVLVSTEKK